jgi:dUTP pyrophosphatase
MVSVKVRKLYEWSKIPVFKTEGAAGADLFCCEPKLVKPGQGELIGTGIALEIPPGYEGQVRTRSGMAAAGRFVVNSPGTIDCDYRGEVKVIIHNLSNEPLYVNAGDRIAQLVIKPTLRVEFVEATSLGSTERGEGGFGSTGTR